MGCAGSNPKDPYNQVVDKHGMNDVRKFVVSLSKAQFIEQSKQSIVGSIKKKLSSLTTNLLGQIDSQKLQIDRKYQKSLSRIETANPKAIKSAQNIHKVKLQQLMGYNEVTKKVADYKNQSKINLQRQQSQAISQLNRLLQQLIQQNADNIPELKKYDSLSEEDRQKFIKTAQIKNKSSIQKGMAELQNAIQQKCNIENFQSKLENIVTKQKLRELSAFADKSFMAGQEKVKGASECRTC